MSTVSAGRFAGIVVLFFVSGAAALIYQVLWMRQLALVFGVTVHAASSVLAAFMTGIALGSVFAGRIAARLRRPLLAFALAEALVAATALLTPVALALAQSVFVRVHPAIADLPWMPTLLRLAIAFAVLLIPTTLMGATLPLVVQSSLASAQGFGRRVGALYGANTAGAVAGTLAAGLWLVPFIGMTSAFRIAAIANLVAAAGAAILGWHSTPGATNPSSETPASAESPIFSSTIARLIALTFIVSGFASMALEVIWFRMLVILLQPTTYAFTWMLATVLAGIAVGSWAAAALMAHRWTRPIVWLALFELILAIAEATSLRTLAIAPTVYEWAVATFREGRFAFFAPMAITSLIGIFPAAFLMGVAFPVGLRAWTGDDALHAGPRVGVIYAINVSGAIAGALVTGFILVPQLGSRWSLVVVASLTLVAGLLLWLASTRGLVRWSVAAAFTGVFVLTLVRAHDPFDVLIRSRLPGERVLWKQEDGHATVTVNRRDSLFLPRPVHRLYINGAHQASDEDNMVRYHRLIGTLPLALHPAPGRALVIGVGGGATAGAVAAFSRDVSVDVVELSTAVINGARWFETVNQGLLARPNVRMHVDDGRNHMLLTRDHYDIVTADIIRPRHAGAGNLYSVEYYRLMKRVLAPRGLAVQWIGSEGETECKLIMRTFLTAFPHATLWAEGLIVGSDGPLVIEREGFERARQQLDRRRSLDAMGLTSFDALVGRYVAGPDELRAYVGPGQVLSDDRPLTEYFLALPANDRPADLSGVRGDVVRHLR